MGHTQTLRHLFAKKGALHLAPGVFDGLSAKLVEQANFSIAYASGGAIARSHGLPDMGLLSLKEIIERMVQIVDAVSIPVIADADNGYGNALNTYHAAQAFMRAGVAGIHLEDQSLPKRCGHYDDKKIIPAAEFVQKLKAAKQAVGDDLYLIARTDAIAVEGLAAAIARAHVYAEAGADMIFIEAPISEAQIETIAKEVPYPKLLNMFYSGKTPIVPLAKLKTLGYQLVIVPSDLQRAAIKAMQQTLNVIRQEGHTETIKEDLVTFKQREAIIGTENYLEISKQFSE